jgi:hypothetical protein
MPQIYVPFTIHYWTWDCGPSMTVDQTCPVSIPRNFPALAAFRWGMALENSGVRRTLMLIGGFGAISLPPLARKPQDLVGIVELRQGITNYSMQLGSYHAAVVRSV